MTTIAIIGTGGMASALGQRLADVGFPLVFGSRSPDKARALAARIGHDARAASPAEAAAAGNVVIFAVPHDALAQAVASTGPIADKLVIDITNAFTPDLKHLTVPAGTSVAQTLQRMLPDAHVIKAFNTLFAHKIADGSYFSPVAHPAYFAGDDEDACRQFAGIAEAMGLRPARAGGLEHAPYLEGFAVLIVQLGFVPLHP